MYKELFTNSRLMLFKHIATGSITETDNLFYLAFPGVWEFVGYKATSSGGAAE